MWRFRTLWRRDKQSFYFTLYPLVFIGLTIWLGLPQLSGDKNQLNAIEDTVVTSSEYTGSANIWLDDSTGFATTQDFEKCRINRAFSVGLIKDDFIGDLSKVALDAIFDKIKAASPYGLNSVDFADQDEANDYI